LDRASVACGCDSGRRVADIGYGHVDIGFHPLEGARFSAREGFSPVVRNLVAHHSASTYDAEERGIDLAVPTSRPTRISARRMRWCGGADLTTGPRGQDSGGAHGHAARTQPPGD
jgi:hypothetical protein